MAIRITQIDDEKTDRIILRVEGRLNPGDSEIVEQVFEELRQQNGRRKIEINLAAISFISADSVAILKRIETHGALLTGLDFFSRQIIETYEAKIIDNKK